MLGNCAASLMSVVTTGDGYGNSTTETVETVLDWAAIAPRASSERVDPHSPAVVTAAMLYGPFGTAINADDLVVIFDHSPSMNGEWQIEGRSGDWASPFTDWRPGFEVALKRVGAI